MTLQRMTVAFFLTVFSLVASHAGAGESDPSSFARYAAGNFSQVPGAVRSELAGRLEDSSAFLSRVRLATNSFAQDPAIALSELLSVYDAAAAPAATFGYGDRIRSERGAVADLRIEPVALAQVDLRTREPGLAPFPLPEANRGTGGDGRGALWLGPDEWLLVAPEAEHVRQLVAFAQRWARQGPLVIHCMAGISRSQNTRSGRCVSMSARPVRASPKSACPTIAMMTGSTP